MNEFPNLDKVGVEIEGGWDREIPYEVRDDCWRHDGSVRAAGTHYTGELASRPYARFLYIKRFVEQYYPDNVDSSCGLHVHFSTKNLGTYERFLDERFQPALVNYLKHAGPRRYMLLSQDGEDSDLKFDQGFVNLKNRLAGSNSFTRTSTPPYEQQLAATSKRDCRYFAVNYCWAFHKTIELRILPMFEYSQNAIYFIERILRFSDRFAGMNSILKEGVVAEAYGNITQTLGTPYVMNSVVRV